MDKKLEGEIINKEAFEVDATIIDARNIPLYNMSATTPQMAYPLDKIILKGEWDCLKVKDIIELSQRGAEVKPDLYPSFVCNRIHKLDHIKVKNLPAQVLDNAKYFFPIFSISATCFLSFLVFYFCVIYTYPFSVLYLRMRD